MTPAGSSGRLSLGACAAVALGLSLASPAVEGLAWGAASQAPGRSEVELDQISTFSHVKVTRKGDVRTLWFVRDDGDEVIESQVDLSRPDELLVPYTRFMFLSYAFAPRPERA